MTDEKNTSKATPDEEPPTQAEFNSAVWRLVSYRKSRVPLVSHMAVMDGVARGALRWYYLTYPTAFERTSTHALKPTAFKRRLVIDRVYTPVAEGITNKWNEWCLAWDLPMMQVFTKTQQDQRLAAGLPIFFPEYGENEPEAEAADEVETAILAASDEFGLDLDAAPADVTKAGKPLESIVVPEPHAGHADVQFTPREGEVDTSALDAAREALRRPVPEPRVSEPEPASREKKFWEE